MLSAILNGKGRRLTDGLPAGASLRMAFRRSEDMLTATVFERLAYLSGPILWKILLATFQPKLLPQRNVVSLDNIEFWPTWGQARGTRGKAVIPDVVLRLTVGDPPIKVILIVECKLDGFQYSAQWAREWLAYRAEAGQDEQSEEVWLLALGGLANGPAATVATFTAEISLEHGFEIRAVGAEWRDLRKAIDDLEINHASDRRIADDIRDALELHGFRSFRPMQDFANMTASLGNSSENYAALCWPCQEITVDPKNMNFFRDLAESTVAFRPIQEYSGLRWQDDAD